MKWQNVLIGICICMVCLLMMTMTGCVQRKLSSEKSETAEVIQLSYIPSVVSHTTGVGPSIGSEGSVGIAIVSATTTAPEQWAVVLRCSDHHKTFALECKELYDRVKAGDRIKLYYVDVLEYDDSKPNSEQVIDQHTLRIEFGDMSEVKRKEAKDIWY